VHDLRCTGSTILNELGSDSDWIEMCLAHENRWFILHLYARATTI
jgi:hypothetical protein